MLSWIIAFIVLAALIVGGAWFLRGHLNGGGAMGFFGPPRERRLDVVEHASVDGRRRLVLIRRDDVEHLIMTGGPVDVVIETNIGGARAPDRVRLAPVENVGERVAFGRLRGERQSAES
jgi:flagellar protein FliO/FliZ